MSDARAKLRSVVPPRPYFGVRWVRFSAPFNLQLPKLACCYCVFDAGRLVYVGQTANLRARFASHKGEGILPASASLKARFADKYGDWAMREIRLIRRLRPPMNTRVV